MSVEGAGVSLGATIVSLVFTAMVFNQWIGRRKSFQLAWSLGLGLYAVAAFMQFLAEGYGWSVVIYKVYYIVGAVLVAVLGIGSAFLVSRRLGVGFALYTAVVSIGFVVAVAGTTVNVDALLTSRVPVAGTAIPDNNVRAFAALLAVPGSIALIGIAAYSYWRTRLQFNLYIGIGALIVAAGGSLAVFNLTWALYVGELVGIAVMFWGFLASQDLAKAPSSSPARIPS